MKEGDLIVYQHQEKLNLEALEQAVINRDKAFRLLLWLLREKAE